MSENVRECPVLPDCSAFGQNEPNRQAISQNFPKFPVPRDRLNDVSENFREFPVVANRRKDAAPAPSAKRTQSNPFEDSPKPRPCSENAEMSRFVTLPK
jgi:hypothetical protein